MTPLYTRTLTGCIMEWSERESCTAAEFEDLIGVTFSDVRGLKNNSDRVDFIGTDGRTWVLFHSQDCCENVSIVDVAGEPDDLIGSPVVWAVESSSSEVDQPSQYADSWMWTFYRIATNKGTVVIRWLGQSNGFYSEKVSFVCKNSAP